MKAKEVDQNGWPIKQYIDTANILFMSQYTKPFKHTKYMAILVNLLYILYTTKTYTVYIQYRYKILYSIYIY